jgi:hypothetical protein
MLQKAIESGLPSQLLHASPRIWREVQFLVYTEKFLPITWSMLKNHGLATPSPSTSHYEHEVPVAVTFLMMSALADSCAGTQVQKVTDRVDVYSFLAEHCANVLGSPYVQGFDASQVTPAYDRLVSISLEVLDAREVPLRKLVELRKRELRTGGSDFSAMRRRYHKTLESYLRSIGKEAKSEGDVRELERQFREDMKQDLSDLKAELGLASKRALLSKEVVLSALILAGSLSSPIAGLTTLSTTVGGIGVIPLMKTAVEYRGARREALRRHTMSWLFLGTAGRIAPV